MLRLILAMLCLTPVTLKSDGHWGTTPPVPELSIDHFPAMGVIEISFLSDSTWDQPIWYILEVKQEGDPTPYKELVLTNSLPLIYPTVMRRGRSILGSKQRW